MRLSKTIVVAKFIVAVKEISRHSVELERSRNYRNSEAALRYRYVFTNDP